MDKSEIPSLNENTLIRRIKLFLKDISDRGVKCKYILDVGANNGDWTRMAKKIFPDSVIYMIEPLSEMTPSLYKVCEDFPGTKYFPKGAGSKIENHVMNTFGEDLASASCQVEENAYFKSIKKQRTIPMLTIDSLIENDDIEIPDLVKLDIQGFELEALKGASKLFGNTEVFILETSLFRFTRGTPIHSDVVKFMAERGYEVYDFPGSSRRSFDGALAQLDVCFAKRDGTLRASNAW